MCKFLNNRKFSIPYTKASHYAEPVKCLFYATTGKSLTFERLYVRAFCQIASRFENYRNNFRNIKNLKWIIYPMGKGAANSKRMCIICHYLIAQNGDACTSFLDTLVGSVNNNARARSSSVRLSDSFLARSLKRQAH